MSSSSAAARIVRAAALLFAGLGAYHLGVRPRLLRWGAEDGEVTRAFPGDGRIADPHLVSTRAVSVAAEPRDIWPWLVQMGDGRGGLYSHDRLDMLFGYIHAPSANVVLPQYQGLAVGDVIPLGRGPDWPVTIVDRERALVVEPAGADITWCWRIIPARRELDASAPQRDRSIPRSNSSRGPRKPFRPIAKSRSGREAARLRAMHG